MTETLRIKGVTFRTAGLAPESRAYLEAKLRRARRTERREANPFYRLVDALLPRDYRRVPVESRVSGKVLVVGCAGGIETLGLGAVGIDVDRPALRVAADLRAHAEGASALFAAASGAELPFPDGLFDSVLSDNVVEHLPEGVLQRHLREACRVLHPGGRCVFTTPNRIFENPAKEGHVSLHSYAEWEGMAKEAGFSGVLTPRRRSGDLGNLSWKIETERRGRRPGLSHQGVRMVTIVAVKALYP